jgi:photosystem II stability/assembly factor-like uncharacterized protein
MLYDNQYRVTVLSKSCAVYTLSAMMMVLLLAPLYDLARMAQAANVATSDSTTNPSTKLSGVGQATSLQADEGLQARTQLNLMLTMAAFTLLHFMRRMGAALGECSRLKSTHIDSHTERTLHPVLTPEIVETEPETFKAAAFLPGDEAVMVQDEALKKEE